jgi:LysM repeat protein
MIVALATLLCLSGWSGVSAAPNLQGGPTYYVQAGETLEWIAARYGVTVDALLRYNGLSDPDFIYVGQQLYIPPGGQTPEPAMPPGGYTPAPWSGPAMSCGRSHEVRPGETLSDIAFRYGVSLSDLVRLNNMANSNMVFAGQSLCLPGGASYAPQMVTYAPPPNVPHHRVVPGDTVFGIAGRYGVDYQDLIRANQLGNAAIIVTDQVLVIPGYQAQPMAPGPQPGMAPGPQPGPAPAASYAPQYVAPPQASPPAGPPPAPYREDIFDSSVFPPVDKNPPYPPKAEYDKNMPYPPKAEYDQGMPYPPKADIKKGVPAAPEYQAEAKKPPLPLADHPIEVVVNGGVTWVDEFWSDHDPDSITTLIVKTGDEYGLKVRIRSGDYEAEGLSDISFLGEFGPNSWVFRYIPPGDYDVWIEDPERPSEKVKVDIEPGERVLITFREGLSFSGPTFASPSGWFLAAYDNPSKPNQNIGGWSNILVRAPASGLKVRIESEGGYQAYCTTGAKGDGACDFAALMAGFYYLTIEGTDFTVKTYMDGAAYATFDFARQGGAKTDKDVIGPVDYPIP